MSEYIQFESFDSWITAAKDNGYDIESWGMCGSKSAHDINGRVVGEWIAPFDTSDGKETGWLDFRED